MLNKNKIISVMLALVASITLITIPVNAVEGEATAWTFEVDPGSYSGNVSVTVDGVTKTTETTLSGGTYVFGLAIAKIVDASAISAVLGDTAIVIE